MRKKIVIVFLAAALGVGSLAGCSLKQEQSGISTSAEQESDVISAKELLKATDYDVSKYVKLCDYKNMSVEITGNYDDVTEDDVKEQIEKMLVFYPAYETIDKTTIEKDDMVNISYEAVVDGEKVDSESEDNEYAYIGNESHIDGFEDGLIGKNVGDTVTLNLTFPDDYSNTDLAGKDVSYSIYIKRIVQEADMTYDTLTDDYVSDTFGYESVDEYKEKTKEGLQASKDSKKKSAIQEQVLAKLTADCEVTFPDGLLDEKTAAYKDQLMKQAESTNSTFEEYMGISEDSYDKSVGSYMSQSLTQELILEALVKDMDTSISEKDFNDFAETYIQSNGLADMDAFYEQFDDEAHAKLYYAESKALDKLVSEVKVTVTKPENTDSSAADEE